MSSLHRVKDKTVRRIHDEFKALRNNFSTFYDSVDDSKIRFSFSEVSGSHFLFRVKFSVTHKTVKFFVPQDSSEKTFGYQCLEKTTNIVEDIDSIHNLTKEDWVDISSKLEETCRELFLWGIEMSKNRGSDVFRVDAVPYVPNTELLRTRLYYGLITATQITPSKECKDYSYVTLSFLTGEQFVVYSRTDTAELIKPGRIILINYKGSYNILTFNSAKHHVNFAPSDYNALVQYYDNRQTECV